MNRKLRYRNFSEYVEHEAAHNAIWRDYEYEHLADLDELLETYPELCDMDDALNGANLPADYFI